MKKIMESAAINLNKRTLKERLTSAIYYMYFMAREKKRDMLYDFAMWIVKMVTNEKGEPRSNHLKRAINELKLLESKSNDTMQATVTKNVEALLRVLSMQRHSGFSVMYILEIFNLLIKGHQLTKLTFDDDEFDEVPEPFNFAPDKMFQNKRNSAVFMIKGKEDEEGNHYKRYTYNDSMKLVVKYDISANGKIRRSNTERILMGAPWVVMPDGKVGRLNRVNIKDKENFHNQTFKIPVYNVEPVNGYVFTMCKLSDLNDMTKIYSVEIENLGFTEYILRAFKDRADIAYDLVDKVKKHMYKGKLKTN